MVFAHLSTAVLSLIVNEHVLITNYTNVAFCIHMRGLVVAISLVVFLFQCRLLGGSSIPDLETLWNLQETAFLRDVSIGRSLTKDVSGKHYFFLTYSEDYDR